MTAAPGRSHRSITALAATASLALLMTTACYTYHPVAVESLRVQSDVRARLTPGQLEELREMLPAGDRVIEGRVLERESDGVLLLVPVVSALRGARVETINQRLSIRNTGFVEVEVRELDRVRTGLALGAGAVVVGVVVARMLDEAVNPGSQPGGPGTGDLRPRAVFAIGIRR